ncbi:MAG: DUF1254 domain-containing protein [Isosphaeraceae bacterium]
MTSTTIHHLVAFAPVALATWAAGTFAFIYFQPRIFYTGVRRAVLRGFGVKAGGIPVNTFYALSALNSPAMSKSDLVLTGNRDTLYTGGGLDLAEGPQILHVPDMPDRYYSVELFGPWLDVVAIVGRRTTGTRAGDYLISGPDWRGAVPVGLTQIVSPSNSLLVIGRVLVEGEGDLSTAHDLAKQIQVAPLASRTPSP